MHHNNLICSASSPNTGFGVANSGFGSTASTGFGSPAMVGQPNNLGFGSPPMFGSMGMYIILIFQYIITLLIYFVGTSSSSFNQAPIFGGAATFGSTAPTFGQNGTINLNIQLQLCSTI